jgi:predicted SprT family Zn-dependent metalloprotease
VLAPTALETECRAALAAVGRALFILDWPEIPVSWNKRLRRAGRAVIDTRSGRFLAAKIELSPAYFEVYPDDLPGILVHEAVHVGLALQGRPFGHGPAFRRACDSAGGLLHSRWLPGRVFRYHCPICETILERRRRASDSRWCADCVTAAERTGEEAFTTARAMRLVGTAYCGPETAATRSTSCGADLEPNAE